MINDDGGFLSGGLTVQVGWLGLRVGGYIRASLHSSNEPGELSQWLCHDDSTISSRILGYYYYYYLSSCLFSDDTAIDSVRTTIAPSA